jgi:hypothetical protein
MHQAHSSDDDSPRRSHTAPHVRHLSRSLQMMQKHRLSLGSIDSQTDWSKLLRQQMKAFSIKLIIINTVSSSLPVICIILTIDLIMR